MVKRGGDCPASELHSTVLQVLAIDLTARDLQTKAKKGGLPWTQAKGYDTFTAVSDFIPKASVPDPDNLNLWLKVVLTIVIGLVTGEIYFAVGLSV